MEITLSTMKRDIPTHILLMLCGIATAVGVLFALIIAPHLSPKNSAVTNNPDQLNYSFPPPENPLTPNPLK